jgi:hypothetical protein
MGSAGYLVEPPLTRSIEVDATGRHVQRARAAKVPSLKTFKGALCRETFGNAGMAVARMDGSSAA